MSYKIEYLSGIKNIINGLVAELVDALDSKPSVERRVGSIPTMVTNVKMTEGLVEE